MKKLFLGNVSALCLAVSAVSGVNTVNAQKSEKVKINLDADLVSSYIWRGTDCGGTAIQPCFTATCAGFSFGVWGSAGFDAGKFNMTEFDLSIGYAVGNLTLSVTDYYFCDKEYAKYWNGGASSAQQFEGSIGYDFGVAALSVNTMFSGNDYKTNGDRAYSTYIGMSAPFAVGEVKMKGEVGFTPFESNVYGTGGFAVCNCCMEVEKSLTELLSMKGSVIYNPSADAAYFTIGVSF